MLDEASCVMKKGFQAKNIYSPQLFAQHRSHRWRTVKTHPRLNNLPGKQKIILKQKSNKELLTLLFSKQMKLFEVT